MRHYLIILLSSLLLYSCNKTQSTFSKSEIILFKKISFNEKHFESLKNSVQRTFTQYATSDPGYTIENGEKQKTGIEYQNGISFAYPEQQVPGLLGKYREQLLKSGYLIFESEQGYEEEESIVSVIKSTDQFDILRLEKTDGVNFDILNEDIIRKLTEWSLKYGIVIYGADYDWVKLQFNKPENAKALAKEIYEFCPDTVDQGVGEIEALEKIIESGEPIMLWWD